MDNMKIVAEALKYLAENSKNMKDVVKYTAAYNVIKDNIEEEEDSNSDSDISKLLIEYIKQNLPEGRKERRELQKVVSYIGTSKNKANEDKSE